MGKFDGVLIASDFDNTLVYTEAARREEGALPQVSRKNREAINYFMEGGGRFAIATGRALPAFARFAPQVPMNAPGVLCNGAVLYDFSAGAYLDTILLPPQSLERGQEVLDRFPTVAVEAYHVDNVIHVVRPNLYTRQHIHVTHVAVEDKEDLLGVPLPLGKLMFEEDHACLEQVREWILHQPWAGRYEVLFSAPTLLELTALGANKGGMVRRLAARLGIAMDRVYCVGDEANDLSMLTAGGEGFAPENCSEAVRRSGVTLVRPAWEDALAHVVEILDQRY